MAVGILPSQYLVRVLVNECASVARDASMRRLHECLLSFLREACTFSPLVVTDVGIVYMQEAVTRAVQTDYDAHEARVLIAQLTARTSRARA